MKITVLTSNQPRHLSLINHLAGVADEVFAIQECNTVFPGLVDDFFRKSEVMQDYFGRVMGAEKSVFGEISFSPENVRSLSIKLGDLNRLGTSILESALNSDVYVVFGASYIKGELIDHLVANRAVNIHMGVSPYYRGSSCNFWAQYDGNPGLVGSTIHMLSKGLDSGDMLYHALPKPGPIAPFELGMRAVRSAHRSLVDHIAAGTLFEMPLVPQSKDDQIRYTRNSDFDDQVASDFLSSEQSPEELEKALARPLPYELLNPVYL